MKNENFLVLIISCLILFSCSSPKPTPDTMNPFYSEYGTPYQLPPFGLIKNEHFLPAFREGIRLHKEEVEAIVSNTELPSFSNTIEALEYSGSLLKKVNDVFYNLTSSNTNDTLQQIAKEIAPEISRHNDDINLNPVLFARISQVYEQRDSLNLSREQYKLLENKYKDLVRGGANLKPEDQERFRQINEGLSTLTLQFGDNLLAETNRYRLVIDDERNLSGLPSSVVTAAAETAKEEGMEGKWVFTLDAPSRIPFLQYADNRDLRKELFLAYINKGNNDNENDNKAILSKIVRLRTEKARLLGYASHADFILEKNMAKQPENVYKLLNQLWERSVPVANQKAVELQARINADGRGFSLEPWDWWYYAEKVKKEKYNFDEEALRPYFKLENVIGGVFEVSKRLYGLEFVERKDLQAYHPDARAYEVKEADGTLTGILYMDFFPRSSKRGGAWMNNYRDQYRKEGTNVIPVVTVVCNFSKPSADRPALLSFEEVSTLFHEFGHALHGLLSNCTYPSISGTSVPRDFVELPSQIMENWAAEPEVLQLFALHFETGQPIPAEMITNLKASENFNQAFNMIEYLAASILDMDYHTLKAPFDEDVLAFEKNVMAKIGLMPQIVSRYRSTYFQHIFSGGYSAGYYSYMWAEVLDADAFQAFKETSLFDPATASSFRNNILSRGGTEDPMTLYKQFRGAEPAIEPLLRKKGLL
jgi:peptidyl-dipeptidase Dcp